jgi:hypothetical protein
MTNLAEACGQQQALETHIAIQHTALLFIQYPFLEPTRYLEVHDTKTEEQQRERHRVPGCYNCYYLLSRKHALKNSLL